MSAPKKTDCLKVLDLMKESDTAVRDSNTGVISVYSTPTISMNQLLNDNLSRSDVLDILLLLELTTVLLLLQT